MEKDNEVMYLGVETKSYPAISPFVVNTPEGVSPG
jgi:hypothetical protein